MLLVDALYVNYGGALNLLRYLVDTLKEKNTEFFLLADARCVGEFDSLRYVKYLKASISNRKGFYKKHIDEFSSVFCFGNVPPPIQLNVPTYTYFHNINMLTLSDCRDWTQRLKFWLKRTFIKLHRRNTDEWFVQTSNTANELVRHMSIPAQKIKLFPFYRHPVFPKYSLERTDYIFVGEYSGSKGHMELLNAWKLLHEKGFDLTLHLTVSLGEEFLQGIRAAIKDGLAIVNHGFIPMEQLSQLYTKSKATIYPSYNESFGLGLVEAMEFGCDVIASDRPFTYAICEASEVFNPYSPVSIAEAVIRYEQGHSKKTKQLVFDQIDKMILRILAV